MLDGSCDGSNGDDGDNGAKLHASREPRYVTGNGLGDSEDHPMCT